MQSDALAVTLRYVLVYQRLRGVELFGVLHLGRVKQKHRPLVYRRQMIARESVLV
jgi:hypothetical protein